jgi:SAM-dependent methyltransferase
MSFNVAAEAYGRFMGRFSEPLAAGFADAAGVSTGQRAVDVGCGPGALTAVLVERLGADAVSAIDPSPPFVEAMRQRYPDVDLHADAAEHLPFADDTFDLALAQLVVHFMADPVAGLREMARVTRPGGTVAACVWDHAGGGGPLATFWQAARDLDPGVHDESDLAGAREGHLAELCDRAGLTDIEAGTLSVTVTYPSFDEWWESYTLGVGPAGAYVVQLDDAGRDALRAHCQELLPEAPFDITATAWNVVTTSPGGGSSAAARH